MASKAAQTTKRLALNQGLYNLSLASGVFGRLALIGTGHLRARMILVARNCASMQAAAVALAASSPEDDAGALIHGLPPLIFLLGAAYPRLR